MEEEKKVTKKTGKTTAKKSTTASKTASKSTTKKTTTKASTAKKSSSSASKKVSISAKKEEPKTQKKKAATTTKKTSTTPKKKSNASTTKSTSTKRKTVASVEKKQTVAKKDEVPQESKREKFVISEDIPKEVEITPKNESKKEEFVKETSNVTFSNIIIAAIVVVWIFILLFLGSRLYHKYQEKLYDEGYFYHENTNIKKVSVYDLQDLIDNSISQNMFLFFNYRHTKETYELEKDLATIISDYHLQDNFYYIDLTDMVGELNCELSCLANEGLGIESINHIPSVVYVHNKAIIDIAQREDQKVLEAADFVKLLDMYEFKK